MEQFKINKETFDENITATVLTHSINPWGEELVSFELVFPRFILAEFNTHRVFSRNSASSRAIPFDKQIKMLKAKPYIPRALQQNQRGMQGGEVFTQEKLEEAQKMWREGLNYAMQIATNLEKMGVHKQWFNRVLEPYMYHTVIMTTHHIRHFFDLRYSELAQPEIAELAYKMRKALKESKPKPLNVADWHLPFVDDEDLTYVKSMGGTLLDKQKLLCKISVAHCARVSYLTHDGQRDYEKDAKLADMLEQNGHWSPFEHVAAVGTNNENSGNFYPSRYVQYRKCFSNEFKSR